MASTNKKRPNNLVIGRTYDRRVLDVVELGVTYYKSVGDRASAPKKRPGSKPLLHFAGDAWHADPDLRRTQNLLIDALRGDPVESLVLKGLDHVISFVVGSGGGDATTTIHMRTYFCKLKKHPTGASDAPVPYLVSCGPDADLRVRRTQLAAPDVWRAALKQPKAARPTARGKRKNRATNLFGETVGRLHLEKQDLERMGGRKSKALRIAHRTEKEEEERRLEEDLKREKTEDGEDFRRTFGFAEVEREK